MRCSTDGGAVLVGGSIITAAGMCFGITACTGGRGKAGKANSMSTTGVLKSHAQQVYALTISPKLTMCAEAPPAAAAACDAAAVGSGS